jgi:hypothetical protein
MQHAQERVSSLLAEVERLVREDTLPAPAKREVLTAVRAARDATTAAASRESVRPSYEFNTPSGVVQFSRRIMWFYPAPIGWARMQRLHAAGTSEYRSALAAALGQIVASHPDLHAALFRTMLSHIAFSRTIDGLESLYLTLLHSAAFHGHGALYKVGLGAWTAYGPPRVTGGDLGFTLFYNVAIRWRGSPSRTATVASCRAGPSSDPASRRLARGGGRARATMRRRTTRA